MEVDLEDVDLVKKSDKKRRISGVLEQNDVSKIPKNQENTENHGTPCNIDIDIESATVQLTPHLEKSNETQILKEGETERKIFETLDGFQVKKVLSNNADCKRVIIEGSINDQPAIIILDKKPFTAEVLPELFSIESKLCHTFQNDIYGSYDCIPNKIGGEIKTTIVYPATQKHIDKYIYHPLYLINETPKIYTEITLPYLEKNSFSVQWVFNILEHKQEADRIVFEDTDPETGFILLPDLKWDGKAIENLYLTAIVHKKGLKSLRDLTSDHLPLLSNIWENGAKAIFEKYGLQRSQLRVYIHYQPSYYHLHVHFTSLQFNAPGIYAEKSHLLQTVIENIKTHTSFYQDATLPFVIKETDNIFNSLREYGYDF